MQHENFDGQISHGLRQYQPVYKEEYWKNLEAKLDAQDRQSKGYLWGKRLLLPAAIVAVAISASIIPFAFDTADPEAALPAIKNITKKATELAPQPVIEETAPEAPKDSVKALAERTAIPSKNDLFKLTNEKLKESAQVLMTPALPERTTAIVKEQTPVIEEVLEDPSRSAFILERLPLIQQRIAPVNILFSDIVPKALKQKKHSSIASTAWQGLLFNFWDNPAYTGHEGRLSLVLNHHVALDPASHKLNNAESIGADFRLLKGFMAVGVYYHREAEPFAMHTESGVTTSARVLNLGHGSLKAGVGVSLLTRQFSESLNAFSTLDRVNPALRVFSEEKRSPYYKTAIGTQAGVWYDSKNLIAGLNIKNLNRPMIGERHYMEKLPVEYSLNAGYNFNVNGFKVMPWVDVSKAGSSTRYESTVFFSYRNIAMLGAGVNNLNKGNNDGRFVIYTGTELCNRLRLFTSVSCALNSSKFGPAANATVIHSGIRYRIP